MTNDVKICKDFIEDLEERTGKKYKQVRFSDFDKTPLVLSAELNNSKGTPRSELEKEADKILAEKASKKGADAIAEITYNRTREKFVAYCFAYRALRTASP